MNKLETLKTVSKIIVSFGVGFIVNNAIGATTPSTMGTIKKVCVIVGGVVLGNMISDKAADYTEQKIDEAVKNVKEMVKEEEPSLG